jgi:hypothetical protein
MKVHFCQKNLPNRTFTHVQVISLHPPINPKTLHMGILVNAIIIDTVSFPPICPLPQFVFHLRISRNVLGPCHTCFGHVPGANGYVVCNMLQDPYHMLLGMLLTPETSYT